jgi:hypothetical protein
MLGNIFIILAMMFFLYAETSIVSSQKICLTEKLFTFIFFSIIEVYYILHLMERLGL